MGVLSVSTSIRKKYPAELKAKIVVEILKEEKTISQIASEYDIYPFLLKLTTDKNIYAVSGNNELENPNYEIPKTHIICGADGLKIYFCIKQSRYRINSIVVRMIHLPPDEEYYF